MDNPASSFPCISTNYQMLGFWESLTLESIGPIQALRWRTFTCNNLLSDPNLSYQAPIFLNYCD